MLVAAGRMTNDEIAADVGVSPSTLAKWKLRADFKADVEDYRTAMRGQVLLEGLALKANRMRVLDDLYLGMRQFIDARAADPAMQNIPGGTTGLLKRTVRSIGSGTNAAVIEEGSLDVALIKTLLAILDQAAREMPGE